MLQYPMDKRAHKRKRSPKGNWSLWVLKGSGDLVSKVISTLIGVIIISTYKYSYLTYNPT